VFGKLWSTYFEGKIGKLAIHPMSNYVVAKGVERLDKDGLERAVGECKAVSGGRGMISELLLHGVMIFANYQNPQGPVFYKR
jgi:nucleolar protein 9